MRPPLLGEKQFFRIPPYVTFSELELKLIQSGLSSNANIQKALYQAKLAHSLQTRNSGAPVLEEHLNPVAMTVLEYQTYQRENGNPEFARITPEGAVVALTHDIFDDGEMDMPTFKKLFGERMFEFVWPLTDLCYWGEAKTYKEKIERKFERIKSLPWQTWVVGLADRLNNSLCFYTRSYIYQGKPTDKMSRGLVIVEDIAMPFARTASPDFFYLMFEELITHYRRMYPSAFRKLS